MLIAKGYGMQLREHGGRKIYRPPGAFMHDPSGADWPKCSVLIGSFTRGRYDEVESRPAEDYFNYIPRGGVFRLPPSNLDQWVELAEIDFIKSYMRPGDKEYEGKYNLLYKHGFKKVGSGFLYSGDYYPLLYRRGRLYRLELGSGCEVNWRGFVYP